MIETIPDTFEATTLPPRSKNACQCPTCGRIFGGVEAFDRHRTGAYPDGRRCLNPAEMRRKGFALDDRGVWVRPREVGR